MALVPCFHCNRVVEDFTTSSYRLVGPHVARICADCAQGVSAEEQADYEQYQLDYAQLGVVQNIDGSSQIDDSLLDDGPTATELAEFANEQQDYELAYIEGEAVNAHPAFKVAEKQVCVCPKYEKNIVYTDTIDAGNDEHDRLDGYYCVNCNSFWREL